MTAAPTVLTDAYVSLNSVVLSTWVRSVTLTINADEQDASAMGASGFKTTLVGLKDGEITIEFNQDYQSGGPDATLASLQGVNTGFPFEIRPTSSAVGSTNPKYTGTAILFNYQPLGGAVGSTNVNPTTMKVQGAVTRATS